MGKQRTKSKMMNNAIDPLSIADMVDCSEAKSVYICVCVCGTKTTSEGL